jgi:hypothetical protein
MPVVALGADVPRETAMRILEKAGAAGGGLVLGAKRLLVRARNIEGLGQVRAAAAEHAAAPIEMTPRFMVVGARPREHEADVAHTLGLAGWPATVVLSFVRGGGRTCVMTAPGPPPFRVLERGDDPPLVVNGYDRSELPRAPRRELASTGVHTGRRRMKLPPAEEYGSTPPPPATSTAGSKRKLDEQGTPGPAEPEPSILQRVVNALSPQRKRQEGPAEEAMVVEHVHSFAPAQTKAKDSFTCPVCQEERRAGQMRRTCTGCGAHACSTCSRQ